MSAETLRFRLTGVAPLVMHNSRLADPLDPWSREIAAITTKRHKTIADHAQVAKCEWYGSAWVDNSRPCIPAHVIEGVIAAAARSRKRGGPARSGLICVANAALVHDGPDTLDELWEDQRFRLRMPVRTPGGRVMRTRPIFQNWQVDIAIRFLPSVVDAEAIEGWLKLGGDLHGIGDFRPRHGRYAVERLAVHGVLGSAPVGSDWVCQDSVRQGSVGSARGEEPTASPPRPKRPAKKKEH